VNYAIEMGLGAMMYITSLYRSIQPLKSCEKETHKQKCDFICLLIYFFFQNKESRRQILFPVTLFTYEVADHSP
jgi:hypothetical protein